MGRRRTLINGFGANWATGRVSVKNARLPSEHDGNSNCRSVVYRLCAIVLVANNPRFEYSRENHCIISYTRFVLRLSPSLFCFSVSLVFTSVPIFPCSCWFLSHFFWFSSVHQVWRSLTHRKRDRKKRISVMSCQRCHRGRIKLRFSEQEKKNAANWMVGRLDRVFVHDSAKIRAQKRTRNPWSSREMVG